MKKLISILLISALALFWLPTKSFAAGGIYASGGGSHVVGESFSVTVSASGATFNALEGTISVSGPVSISSFSAGGATWTSIPANGTHFIGMIIPATDSLRVATIKLKATGIGSGAVSVSSVRLANAGADVGSGAGSASFSIAKAPQLASVTVTSASHPDQNQAYEATKIDLAWKKASGVTGFSYLLDQTENTMPPTKVTSADTSISYPDKAIGTYYFHIRAINADGWGGTTHFKINIKVPDAKIDETLAKPSEIKIEKTNNFVNDVKEGTVSGVKISGKTEIGYTAKITLTPAPALPEGKKLEAVADNDGKFALEIDWLIPAGHYKITVQGQKELKLTPISDEIIFEISQAKGGAINILTSDDIYSPKNIIADVTENKWLLIADIVGAVLIIGLIVLWIFIRRRRKNTAK